MSGLGSLQIVQLPCRCDQNCHGPTNSTNRLQYCQPTTVHWIPSPASCAASCRTRRSAPPSRGMSGGRAPCGTARGTRARRSSAACRLWQGEQRWGCRHASLSHIREPAAYHVIQNRRQQESASHVSPQGGTTTSQAASGSCVLPQGQALGPASLQAPHLPAWHTCNHAAEKEHAALLGLAGNLWAMGRGRQ